MKRPLTAAGFSFGAGVFMVSLFGYKIALILCLLSAASFTLCLFIKRLRKAAALTALIFLTLGLFAGGLNSLKLADTAARLNGVQVTNAEFIAEDKTSRSRAVGTLKISEDESVAAELIANDIEPYQIYRVSGEIKEISGQYKRYYLSYGAAVQLVSEVASPTNEAGGNPLLSAAAQIRGKCSEKLYKLLPQRQANVIDALLLGNKDSLDDAVYDGFRLSGVAHIAVVSGAHMSVIVAFVYGALYFLTRRRRLSSAASIAAVLCFMLITGLSLSVVRAGIMCIIFLLGRLFARNGDSLNSLGGAVLLITAINPASVYDMGFLLSVFATLGIITLAPCMANKTRPYLSGALGRLTDILIVEPLCVTMAAVLATAPILIISFKYIGAYFIITNIILFYITPILLSSSLLLLLSSFAPFLAFITYPLALISGAFADIISSTVMGIASLPGAKLDISMPHTLELTIILVSAVAIFGAVKKSAAGVLKASFCAVVIFSLVLSIFTALNAGNAGLILLPTGKGISAMLTKNGELAAISCGGSGGKYRLLEELEETDPRCILAIKGGARECGALFNTIYENRPADNIFIQNTDYNRSIIKNYEESDITLYDSQQNIELWDSVKIRLIPIEKTTITVIELRDEYILLLPNPEYAAYIPEKYSRPSMLVTTAPLPDDTIDAGTVIIAANEQDDEENAARGIYNENTISLLQSSAVRVSLSDKILYTQKGD